MSIARGHPGAAHLFAGSKLAHLALLPHGSLQAPERARAVSRALDAEFGPCSLYGECAQVCPAQVPLRAVGSVPRQRLSALWRR